MHTAQQHCLIALSCDVFEETDHVSDILAPLFLMGTSHPWSFILTVPLGLIPSGSGLMTVLSADFCFASGVCANGKACKVLLWTMALLFYSRNLYWRIFCPFWNWKSAITATVSRTTRHWPLVLSDWAVCGHHVMGIFLCLLRKMHP